MAGNQGAPIDLTGSPQDGVRNKNQHGGVVSPRKAQGAPRSPGQAFNPLAQGGLAENLNEALARLDRQPDEAAAQRAVHRHGREARRHQNIAARQRLVHAEQHRQQLDPAEQQRLAHVQDLNRRHIEAMQANARRQVYLRQQHEVAAPQVGQGVGQGVHEGRNFQEWERRRQRVANDVERIRQRTLQHQQQAQQDPGVAHNEPAAHVAELERQQVAMRDQAERQRVEMRQQVERQLERQHLEMRARLQEAQAQMIRARLEAPDRVERNGVEEPRPKRARHVEIAREIEIARQIEGGLHAGHRAEDSATSQRQHPARLVAPTVDLQGRAENLCGMGASGSGRAYDAGALHGGAGPSMPLAEALDTLGSIFPDIDLTAAGASLTACAAQHGCPLSRALELLTNAYFEDGYPKREPKAEKVAEDEGGAGPSKQEEKDVFSLGPPPAHCMAAYHKWAVYQLQVDFPRVSLTDVRKCLKVHQERYAAAYKAILTEMQKIRASSVEGKGKAPAVDSPGKGAHDSKSAYWAPNFKLLQKPRLRPRFPPEEECDEFQEELLAVHRATLKDQELEDMLLAEKLNEEEYAGEGQEIECGCCCCEYPFEKMVQCAEGHLFCFACLKRRVEESTFGASSAGGSLPCMDTDGCQAEFPHAEVQRALPEATLAQYEARQAEQALLSAKLDNLVRCPFCDFACEVDEGNRVLDCPGCKKASCRECKEPSHIPLKCSEVEKKGETAFRLRVEELMTKALVRECSKCRTELIKDAGCNKVTCRCGQTMCYICRAAINPDYTHFCQHFREPDRKCHACTKCNLFTTGNDAEEVKRIRAKAIEEAAHLDPEAAKRMIGAPDDLPQPKRPRPHTGQLLPGLAF